MKFKVFFHMLFVCEDVYIITAAGGNVGKDIGRIRYDPSHV